MINIIFFLHKYYAKLEFFVINYFKLTKSQSSMIKKHSLNTSYDFYFTSNEKIYLNKITLSITPKIMGTIAYRGDLLF